jgi:hypothetical protein
MNGILVDTSVWIDYFRAEATPQVLALIQMIRGGDEIHISPLIEMEILQGIADDHVHRRTQDHLSDFSRTDLDERLCAHASLIYRSCRKRGITIRRQIDCLIAASAMRHQLVLLHDDKDFTAISTCTDLIIWSANAN